MPDASRPTGVALVPPPAMFLLPLLFGLWLNSRFPIGRVPASASRPLEWLGVALIAAGLAHVLPSIALFLSKRTTIIPHQHASTFVRMEEAFGADYVSYKARVRRWL